MKSLFYTQPLRNYLPVRRVIATILWLLLPAQLGWSAIVNVLFVGNSYTHGRNEPILSYNRSAITDANGTNQGGIPGIFKKLTTQVGLNYDVTIEAVSAQTLTYHFSDHAATIGASRWDVIVLQEQSSRPVPSSRGGNPNGFNTAVRNLNNLIVANSNADVFLYQTWARPDLVFPVGEPYSGTSLTEMQNDLRNAYNNAATVNSLAGVAPVGDAFMRAISEGVADSNPYDGISPGKLNLWASDNTHASLHGAYLSATVLFRQLTGEDPRQLSVGIGSAAADLNISPTDASRLHQIAFVSVVPEPSAFALLSISLAVASVLRRPSRRGACPSNFPLQTSTRT